MVANRMKHGANGATSTRDMHEVGPQYGECQECRMLGMHPAAERVVGGRSWKSTTQREGMGVVTYKEEQMRAVDVTRQRGAREEVTTALPMRGSPSDE